MKETSRTWRFGMAPMEVGRLPCSAFLERLTYSSAIHPPICIGIAPESVFADRSRNLVISVLPICYGRGPSKRLLDRLRYMLKLLCLAISAGI